MTPLIFAGCDPDLHTLSIVFLRGRQTALPVIERILLLKAKGSAKEQAVLGILSTLHDANLPNVMLGLSVGMPRYLSAFAVESQDCSYTGRTNAARVSDLLTLAQVAGGVSSVLQGISADHSLQILVKPQAWKGSVPKHIHQCRTLKKLGVEFDMAGGASPYPVPRGLDSLVHGDKLNKGDWKDINDSIGLALYAMDRWNLND